MRTLPSGLLLTLLLAACASTPSEQETTQAKLADLEARVARMERIAANQVEVSQRLDEIQDNLRELRGRLDELEHSNEALGKQQRDLYGDLKKRLDAAGSGAASLAGAAGSASPPDAAGAPANSAPSSVEQAVYGQAFDALKAGSYSVAITGFKDFLATYPASPLAENAQYWLGEAYYVNHDYDNAAAAFRAVGDQYPQSAKVPDSLLKLGLTQIDQKKLTDARATLKQVVQRFPGSDAAKIATSRLQSIPPDEH